MSRRPFMLCLLVSCLLHGLFWLGLFILGKGICIQGPLFSRGNSLHLSFFGPGILSGEGRREAKKSKASPPPSLVKLPAQGEDSLEDSSEQASYVGESSGGWAETGLGQTGEKNGPLVLSEIRLRIERAKIKVERGLKNTEGQVELVFRLHPSGRVEQIEILKVAGPKKLVDLAREILKKAEPFPYYSQPIHLPLRFTIEEE